MDPRRGASAQVGVFELFHLCRKLPFGYLRDSRSANGDSAEKKADPVHVSESAYAGLNESPEQKPIVAPTGVKAVGDAVWMSWKLALCLIVVVFGGCSRIAASLHGVSFRDVLNYCVKRALNSAMGNGIVVVLSLESGFFDGLAESL